MGKDVEKWSMPVLPGQFSMFFQMEIQKFSCHLHFNQLGYDQAFHKQKDYLAHQFSTERRQCFSE